MQSFGKITHAAVIPPQCLTVSHLVQCRGHALGRGITQGLASHVCWPRSWGHCPCFSSFFDDHGTSGRRQTDFLLPFTWQHHFRRAWSCVCIDKTSSCYVLCGIPVESQTTWQTENWRMENSTLRPNKMADILQTALRNTFS